MNDMLNSIIYDLELLKAKIIKQECYEEDLCNLIKKYSIKSSKNGLISLLLNEDISSQFIAQLILSEYLNLKYNN